MYSQVFGIPGIVELFPESLSEVSSLNSSYTPPPWEIFLCCSVLMPWPAVMDLLLWGPQFCEIPEGRGAYKHLLCGHMG